MVTLKLSTLAIILGLLYGLPHLFGLLKPGQFGAVVRKFPRYTPIGYPLMLAATVWSLYYLSLETVSEFASFKPVLYTLFGAIGVGACIFVKDFLPVRGLSVLLLLLAKLMVDSARWVDTEWRLVITTWAYAWVLAGIWFTISPWRLRDLINWATANENRIRFVSGVRLAFGIFVTVLGLTVFKTAEQKTVAHNTCKTPSAFYASSRSFWL